MTNHDPGAKHTKDRTVSEPICEDCRVNIGGEVVIRGPDNVVKWRRVLCSWCFHVRRRNTEAALNVRIVKRGG